MKRWTLIVMVLGFLGCRDQDPSAKPAPVSAPAALDLDDPTKCAHCHVDIAAEWQASQHAAAHDDPIFVAMREMRAGREGEAVARQCVSCHSPRVAERGVTCASCHVGTSAGAHVAGPHDLAAGLVPVHATGPAAPEIADGSGVCMRCHEKLVSPSGVSVCTTGIEWREHATKDGCTTCHMPLVPGLGTLTSGRNQHRSHRFIGPHTRWQDRKDVLEPVTLGLRIDGATVVATLTNKSGHDYPTGFPARMAVIELVGHDASGAEVWRNFVKNPLAEAPDAVLNKVYVDDKGEPTIAPWSVKLARDTRLAPGEVRELRVELPTQVSRVRARALLRLMPPTLADKLGLSPGDELTKPRLLAEANATRGP